MTTTHTCTVTSPDAIFREELGRACRPHVKKINEFLARHRELEKKCEPYGTEKIKDRANEMLQRAERGDKEALAELESSYGVEGWCGRQSGLGDLAEKMRGGCVRLAAPVLVALVNDLQPAVDAAHRRIADEWAVFASVYGLPPGPSPWFETSPSKHYGQNLARTAMMAEMGSLHPRFMLDGLGLTEFFEG
ncbi:MAG: hypothetical protein ACOYOL_05155 [Chthoniobacterales bacterium]